MSAFQIQGPGGNSGERYFCILPIIGADVIANTWTVAGNSSQIYGTYYQGQNQGAEIGFPLVMDAGTWSVSVLGVTNNDAGNLSVQIDGTQVGTMDWYAAGLSFNATKSVTGITVATSGPKTLSFEIIAKNPSSSANFVSITMIVARRTGA